MAQRSTGDTRIFRFAHATSALVRWPSRAGRGWTEWSLEAGEQLVGEQGTVVSGDIDAMAAAMAGAGVRFEVTDQAPVPPAAHPRGPFLIDPHGGVIRAAATGAFLLGLAGPRVVREPVTRITLTASGAELATANRSEAFVRWEVRREEVVRRSRQIVTAYVEEHVTGAVPQVVDTVYCQHTPGLDDGVSAERSGAVLVFWGDNLFQAGAGPRHDAGAGRHRAVPAAGPGHDPPRELTEQP